MVHNSKSSPVRSCVACRREGDKNSLLRFVLAPDGTVIPDIDNRLPGRGAYVCQSGRCLRDAVARRQFSRSFKNQSATPDTQNLEQMLLSKMEQRIAGYVSLANKAGSVISGGEGVERALKSVKRPFLLVMATDVSESISEKLALMAKRCSVPVVKALDKEQLGHLLGKESDRSAVAVLSEGFAQSLAREIERYRNYLEEESGR